MNDKLCPVCLNSKSEPLGFKNHTPYALFRCLKCGLICLHPQPLDEDIYALYPQEYEPFWPPLDEESSRWRRWSRRRHYMLRCRALQLTKPNGGYALDAGCGTGGFAHQLAQIPGWRCAALDITPSALAVARRQLPGVLQNNSERMPFAADTFDAVTLWEVLEHLPDPRATLVEIHRILKTNGTLLLSTPNAESWQAKFWGPVWTGWEIPRHYHIFTIRSLDMLLQAVGFKRIRKFSLPMDHFYFVESMRRWIYTRADGVTQQKAVKIKLAGWFFWPLARLLDRTQISSALVIEAKVI